MLVREIAGGTRAIVLVHGWKGEQDPQDGWESWLESMRWDDDLLRAYSVWRFRYDSMSGVGENGRRLADCLRRGLRGSRLSLIGYSMGGLVCREAMLSSEAGSLLADEVDRLVTLGTPHHGTPLAVPAWWMACAAAKVGRSAYQDLLAGRAAPYCVRKVLAPAARGLGLFHDGEFSAGGLCLAWDDFDGRAPRHLSAANAYLSLIESIGCGRVADHRATLSNGASLSSTYIGGLNRRQQEALRARPWSFEGKHAAYGSSLPASFLDRMFGPARFLGTHAVLGRIVRIAPATGEALSRGYWDSDGIVPLESACPATDLLPGERCPEWKLTHDGYLKDETLIRDVIARLNRRPPESGVVGRRSLAQTFRQAA